MTEQSAETSLALLKAEVERIELHLTATDTNIKALQDERNNVLKWGVIVLGTAVIAMGTWIAQFFIGRIR
jgi:hypothetical protein